MQNKRMLLPLTVVTVGALIGGACSNTHANSGAKATPAVAVGSPSAAGASGERPAPAEKNPAGDIPDTQAFVPFSSTAGGYTVDAPEGWARTTAGANVQFTDKLDGEAVTIAPATAAPAAATARNDLVAAVTAVSRSVQVNKVQDVQLPGGAAVLVDYTANSEPDTVTGKQVRLEQKAYFFFKDGKLASVRLWAPLGADNVDQWQRIARSFRWS